MADRRTAGVFRRTVTGAPDRGYGVIAYLVMGLVVLLIIAGAVLLVRLVSSSGGGGATATPTATSITECGDAAWFDSSTGTCVPRAECEVGQAYDEGTNTCTAPLPTVKAIAPTSGLSTGGTEVRVTGTGFEPGASLLIDGIEAAEVTVVNATTITATTPGSANLYPVDVEVVNPGSEPVLLDNAFVYVAPAVERITALNPDTGSTDGGEAVIIKGVGFVDGMVVSFFGRPATGVEVLNDTTLRVITPAGPTGPVNVNVRNPGGAPYTSENGFRYVDRPPRIVTAVRPARGAQAGGTKVTITGSGFVDGATVTFGRNPARRVVVESSTRITAVTPAGRLGDVPVGVRNPGLPVALLEDAFTYVAAPTITAIKPARGPVEGGTKVTITGTGFGPDALVGIGNVVIEDAKVVDESTITIVMPPAAEPIKVDVSVTNPGEPRALAKRAFTYIEGEPEPEPEPEPTATPTPTPVAQPACRPVRQPPQGTSVGADLILTDVDLFPASLRNPRLTSVSFTGTSGGNAGSVDWTGRPPRIVWSAPDSSPATGVVTFAYQADNCQGTGAGSVITVFSD